MKFLGSKRGTASEAASSANWRRMTIRESVEKEYDRIDSEIENRESEPAVIEPSGR